MKFKEYILIFVITISSTFTHAQEVTIEDVTKDNNDYMSHPDYGKNRNRLYDVDREIGKVLDKQSVFYHQNIKKPGFIYDNSGYSKEKLQRFLVDAEKHLKSLVNNSEFKQLCNERSILIPKVRPNDKLDRCEKLLNSDLSGIDYDIKKARDLIANIEKNKPKKEEGVSSDNLNNFSSNNNSNGNSENKMNNEKSENKKTSNKSNRSLSEAIIGTWIWKSGFTIHFYSNGTGYSTIPDNDKSCYPYYWKAHFNYSLNNSAIIQNYTSIDVYCGNTYSPTILSSLNLVIDSSGAILTDGEGNKYKRN